MNRRNFIKSLTCLPVFALSPGSLACTQDVPRYDLRRIMLLQANVAGYRYYSGEKVWRDIRPGDAVELKREPHNPHDRKAIALYCHGEKVGYIPRIDNSVIANLLDQGAPLNACIRKKTPSPNPRERLRVEVVIRG